MPIAGGEVLTRRQSFLPFLTRGAFDIVQPDVTKVGGISESRHIAWMAQNPALLPWQTVLDNVMLGLHTAGKTDVLGALRGLFMGYSNHQGCKLLAAVTADHGAVLAGEPAQHVGGLDQYLVAELVAEPIVDGFEAIDVTHEDESLRSGGVRRSHGKGRGGIEAAPVEQSRQLIGIGESGQFGSRKRQVAYQPGRPEDQPACKYRRDGDGSANAREDHVADTDGGIEIAAPVQQRRNRGHGHGEGHRSAGLGAADHPAPVGQGRAQALAVVALAARGGEGNERLIDELKSSQDEKVAAAANDAMNRLAEAHQRFMEQPAD